MKYKKSKDSARLTGRFAALLVFLCAALTWDAEAREDRTSRVGGEFQHRATVLDHNGNVLDEDVDREAIHPDDSLALVAFYHSMQGDHWLNNSGWLELPVDFWVGIDRVENVGTDEEPEWRVTRIETIRNNMTVPGHFPSELGNMTYLARIRVQGDLLIGTIPDEVINLEYLEYWHHNGNFMTGEIPWDSFRELPRFARWLQENNLFYGTGIPDHIGEWPVFSRIDIRGNYDLVGTIPASLADIENLEYLRIGQTRVGGDLPDLTGLEHLERIQVEGMPLDPGPIWDWLPNVAEYLEELYIHNTNRTGEIPDWLPRELTTLTDFSVGETYREPPENAIGGDGDDIPDFIELVNLERLSFHGPHFTGNIPDWLGDMLALERIYFYDTHFEGPVPGSLANLENLERIEMYRNHKITGGLPQEFSDLGTTTHFIFRDNSSMEIGQIPDWVGDLTSISSLDFANAGVTGELPDLSGLTNLTSFRVRDNPGLTGDLDETFFAELSLSTFDISRTGLNISEFPQWLNSESSRRNLNHIGLAGLGISGEIPSWLGDMVWLRSLALNDNNFSGSIPNELGDLVQMDSLNLANNQLSGPLPDNFANIGRLGGDIVVLEHLILSGNEGLTGPVPVGTADASYMRHFMIAGTDLCLSDGMEDWLASVPDNANRYFPWRYAGIDDEVVYCRDVSAVPPHDRANIFRLNQNYPNPFNPATTISYEIPVEGQVTLQVYNVVGQRVATLVNETQSAGSHNVEFDASRLASGSYIYRLQVGDQIMTRTMMLVK